MGLGDNKTKFLFRCRGFVAAGRARGVLKNLIRFVGMTPASDLAPARAHAIDEYPLNGQGGFGYTLFEPLTESYAVMDVYFDSDETEILISTCKPERLIVDSVLSFLAKEIGPASGGRLKLEEE